MAIQSYFVGVIIRGIIGFFAFEESCDNIPIKTVSLDPDLFESDIGKVMVKIDTQGWEGRIILGNFDTIIKANFIIFEWTPLWIRKSKVDPLEIIYKLIHAGFTLGVISESEKSILTFSEVEAQLMMTKLESADGTASDPIHVDLVATKL